MGIANLGVKALLQSNAWNETGRPTKLLNGYSLVWTKKKLSSGDLWPRGSLKKKLVRGMFQPWIHKAKGRWFTLKVAKLVCRKIWDNLPFTPPRDPKLTFSQYITVQARRLVGLSRASKKLKMADPTLVDTLLDVDAWCLVTCQAVGYWSWI